VVELAGLEAGRSLAEAEEEGGLDVVGIARDPPRTTPQSPYLWVPPQITTLMCAVRWLLRCLQRAS
jgi:hypothetical protein